MNFIKMHGVGNDYVFIDITKEEVEKPEELAVKMSDRHFGAGSDGLVLIGKGDQNQYQMIMYNSDGSRAEMCGNALRCVAKYLYDQQMETSDHFRIQTDAGELGIVIIESNPKVSIVEINMGKPILDPEKIPIHGFDQPVIKQRLQVLDREFTFTAVSMGNPHCVIFLNESIEDLAVEKYGPAIEKHPMFSRRTNVEFVNIKSKNEVYQRTWERGSGETLGCGTGASAVCVAGVLEKKTEHRIINHLRGGDLYINWDEKQDCVLLNGPAEIVYQGRWLG